MAMAITSGQEMKMTIKSTDTSGSRNKTIRYIDPLAANTTDVKVTVLPKTLWQIPKTLTRQPQEVSNSEF